jgi:Flp pilus assembly protein TadD
MGRESVLKFCHRPPAGFLILALTLAGCAQTQTQTPAPATSANESSGVMNVVDAAIAGGDPSMALKVSQTVLASDPHNLDALYHEGAAYYAMNRCMDAIAVYKVALTVDQKSSEADVGIGRCLLRRDAVTAEQMFEAAVANDPDNASALNDLGIARDLQANHAGAQQAYQQALLLQPGSVSTEVNLGMSLALSGDGPDALQYLGPLATSQEATPKIREDYAAALVAAGRPDEARAVLAIDLPADGVQQLMADFALAISTPPPAAAPTVAPAVSAPAAPAPIEAQPLATQAVAPMPVASAAPVPVAPSPAAPSPAAPSPAAPVQAVPPPAAQADAAPPPAAPTAPPVVVSTAAAPASAAPAGAAAAGAALAAPPLDTAPPAAMPPADVPAASLAAPASQSMPPVTASDAAQQAKNAAAYDLLMR